MVTNLETIIALGKSARFLVGSSHIESVRGRMGASKALWAERVALEDEAIDNVVVEM
jgi:hypothetical protein